MTYKLKSMNTILKITTAVVLTVALAACGGSAKEGKGQLTDLKTELEKLKKINPVWMSRLKKLKSRLPNWIPMQPAR